MNLAFEQADRILGNTKNNPAVGCVIAKNNTLISAGHTSINGVPHAERNAIDFSRQELSKSDLYVTLEPCSNYGKTPPCINAIISKKIKKVYFSIRDPDIRSFNKSKKKLSKNKIRVVANVSKNEGDLFYRSYTKYKKKKLPFVTCKLAVSKDFFTVNKKKRWITNKMSRGRVHLMRSFHDCIITSSKTVIDDNPLLTCRINGLEKRSPSRIVIDKDLKIPIKSQIVTSSTRIRTIIFYNKLNKKKIKSLMKFKIKLFRVPLDKNNNINLKKILLYLQKLGFSRIFLESGISLIKSFLIEELIDDFKIFISSTSIGKYGSSNFKNDYNSFIRNKKYENEKVNLFGDKLLSYKLK